METTDYVSYPIALALKKAGFDWPCISFYRNLDKELWEGGEMNWNNGVDYSAPTLWHAQKWLREVKRMEVNASWSNNECSWFFYANLMDGPDIINLDISDSVYSTYEAALSAGISAALELIITPSPDSRL